MKKSDVYHITQIAVLNSPNISPENKLEILKRLFEDERLALFVENEENEKNKATEEDKW